MFTTPTIMIAFTVIINVNNNLLLFEYNNFMLTGLCYVYRIVAKRQSITIIRFQWPDLNATFHNLFSTERMFSQHFQFI